MFGSSSISVRVALTAFLSSALLSCALVGCSDDTAGADTGADSKLAGDLGSDTVAADLPGPDSHAGDADLKLLAAMMTGGFSSATQAKGDPSYYDITLVMKRIWPASTTAGYWLYVEQAVTGAKPYRQRVYHLSRVDASKLVSKVFEFKNKSDETAAVDAWKQAAPLKDLDESKIVEKPGCGVILARTKSGFSGSTDKGKCLTTYQGATYTMSDVVVTAGKVTSWDRGYDAQDKQVWGAVKGPYIFDQVTDMDPELDK